MNRFILILTIFLFSLQLEAKPHIYSTDLEDRATQYFSFAFFKDTFDYSDAQGIFQKTFRDSSEANFPFLLMFQFDFPLYNGWIDVGWESNFGFGYNSGRGIFSGSQSVSETHINVWTIPVDLGLFLELDLKYLSLSFSGGPSFTALIQNRSDFSADDPGKNIRQLGYGYYGSGKLKVNLNRFFKKNAFKLFNSYRVTRLTMDVEMRYVNYDHFKDPVTISGTSLGVGFTFDFY